MALAQAAFRFGINELAETTHGWHAAQNVDITFPHSTTFLLRFRCQASGGVAHSNIDWQFQYNRNGAGWNNITTSSAVARAVATVAFVNAANCTARLTGGTGTFEASAAGCTEDGLSGGTACDIVANGFTETECAIQIIAANVALGDTIQFRLLQEGAVMTTYAVTPSLTVTALTITLDTSNIAVDGSDVLAHGIRTLDTGALAIAGESILIPVETVVMLETGTIASVGNDLATTASISLSGPESALLLESDDQWLLEDGASRTIETLGLAEINVASVIIEIVPPAHEMDSGAFTTTGNDLIIDTKILMEQGLDDELLLESDDQWLLEDGASHHLIQGAPANLSLTGSDLSEAVASAIETGNIAVAGNSIILVGAETIPLDTGNLAVAGADLDAALAPALETGGIAIAGSDIGLADEVTLDDGILAIDGDDVAPASSAEAVLEFGAFDLVGADLTPIELVQPVTSPISAAAEAATVDTDTWTPAAGALLLAFAGATKAVGTPAKPTVSDTQSLVWTEIGDINSGTIRETLYWARAEAAPLGRTVTVASSGASSVAVRIVEAIGLQIRSITAVPNVGTGSDSSGDPSAWLDAPANSNGVIVGGAFFLGSSGVAPGAGYTEMGETAAGAVALLQTQYAEVA